MQAIQALAGSCAAAVMIGCAPTQLYEGEPRPASEVALISEFESADEVRLVSVDDRSVNTPEVAVLPGLHAVQVHIGGRDVSGMEADWFCTFHASLQAGRRYAVDYDPLGRDARMVPTREGYGTEASVRIVLADLDSGEPIAGCACLAYHPEDCPLPETTD